MKHNQENLARLVEQQKTRLRFKKAFHGKGKAVIQLIPSPGSAGSARTLSGTLNKLDNEISRANASGYGVALTVNTVKGGRRRSEDVERINAVFIDDDSGHSEPSTYIDLPCPPHVLVRTSPGKYHAHWLVSDCSVADFGQLQKQLAARFSTDAVIHDTPRAMRMPGTLNWKVNPPFMAEMLACDLSRARYSVEQLVQGLGLRPLVSPPAAVASSDARHPTDIDWHDVESALQSIDPESRSNWLAVGMALHSTGDEQRARQVWDVWSRRSAKFEAGEQQRAWVGFDASRGLTVRTIFHMAGKGGWESSVTDDMDFAEMFAKINEKTLRFDPQSNRWYRFEGVVWVESKDAALQELHDFVKRVSRSPRGLDELGLGKRMRTAAAMRAVISHMELLRYLHVNVADFDADPNLFAVRNGVVDLRTGLFRAARPEDMLRLQADAPFEEGATAPRFKSFVLQVCQADKELVRDLMLCVGYTMFGHTREQKFFMLHGGGSNGKGVFTRLVKRVMGTYAATIAPNVLARAYSGNPNSPSPALAQLQGPRLILCSEGVSSGAVDDAFVKQIAGGDEITARHAYGPMCTFKPTGKLWLTTNRTPRIAHDDGAMWRRIAPLPFHASFRDAQVDTALEEKLWADERVGILRLLVHSAVKYHANGGLATSEASKNFIRSLRREADPVQWWVSTACVRNERSKMRAADAHAHFLRFADAKGVPGVDVRAWSRRLRDLGFEARRDAQGMYYVGLRLKS
ncbi:hypothetical protein EZ313_17325 [Ramlibacter henchirensis]|uniref:SF3 helicase domain-containing protein n=1 Tax=Ramlibacter henchirensis TaxID=204072 RepID=A0A4Z0BWW3_9BURK|nr:phage/plasmid primase, P4 family [Ramlibacter henchirensis]TFZ02984.1 hypothetical protein EZ313_17325 [Ramlibacter henchirensis]